MANAVALKLQEFWEQNANAWFAQAEALFALRDITAHSTWWQLSPTQLREGLSAFLKIHRRIIKYETLKAHLKEMFGTQHPGFLRPFGWSIYFLKWV